MNARRVLNPALAASVTEDVRGVIGAESGWFETVFGPKEKAPLSTPRSTPRSTRRSTRPPAATPARFPWAGTLVGAPVGFGGVVITPRNVKRSW